MGNVNASGVSFEEFKDQVFGTAVLLLAPRLNTNTKFELSETNTDFLPPVLDKTSLLAGCRTYYDNGSRESRNAQLERYINTSILNSQENLNSFLSLLVRQLKPPTRSAQASRASEVESEVRPELKSEARLELESEARLESEVRPSECLPEFNAESNARPELRSEARHELESEVRPELRSEARARARARAIARTNPEDLSVSEELMTSVDYHKLKNKRHSRRSTDWKLSKKIHQLNSAIEQERNNHMMMQLEDKNDNSTVEGSYEQDSN